MRTALVSALLLVSVSTPALGGPRESLEVPAIVSGGTGAHDVVEAAGLGLTVGLLAKIVEPRVLRAERVTLEGQPIWRVDVAGRLSRSREGCSAIAAWITETGRVVRFSQTSEEARIQDCRDWYFDGDERAMEAARDADPRDWTGDAEESYRDPEWDDQSRDQWDEWQQEENEIRRLEDDLDVE